jgi:hypothetical protein
LPHNSINKVFRKDSPRPTAISNQFFLIAQENFLPLKKLFQSRNLLNYFKTNILPKLIGGRVDHLSSASQQTSKNFQQKKKNLQGICLNQNILINNIIAVFLLKLFDFYLLFTHFSLSHKQHLQK